VDAEPAVDEETVVADEPAGWAARASGLPVPAGSLRVVAAPDSLQ